MPSRFEHKSLHIKELPMIADLLNVTRSTLVNGKGKAGLCSQDVKSVLSWAEDNLMTINLTKTKEMVVRGKVERPLPSIIFYIKPENHRLSFWGSTFIAIPLTGTSSSIIFLVKQGGVCTYFKRACKKYGHSLDYLHYLSA